MPSTIYTHEELLSLLTTAGPATPEFKVDIDLLNKEMKHSKYNGRGAKNYRKKSHSASESRRYSYKKDRAALNTTIAELGSDHDEAAIESNDESGDSSTEIDANEMSSRYFLQRSSAPRRAQKDINPKFATAVANSLATSGSPDTKHYNNSHHYRANRRQSTSQDNAAGSEEDGWIAVGPKNHHHHHRKSFNHEEGAGHKKRFADFNRANRGSFNKQKERKKSFTSATKPEVEWATPTSVPGSSSSDNALETYDLAASESTAREYEAWKATLNDEEKAKEAENGSKWESSSITV